VFETIVWIVAQMMRIPIRILPICLSIRLVFTFFKALSWIETQWFLFYARRDMDYCQTIKRIRENPFCPETVVTAYKFWKANPNHEAFKEGVLLECGPKQREILFTKTHRLHSLACLSSLPRDGTSSNKAQEEQDGNKEV
jgi:hypothetical protein